MRLLQDHNLLVEAAREGWKSRILPKGRYIGEGTQRTCRATKSALEKGVYVCVI
jgi:hypothetical protein